MKRLFFALCVAGCTYLFADQFVEDFYSRIKNRDSINPRVMIAFSGTPGMGKTTLAKALEAYYKGVRISSDEVREHYLNHVCNPWSFYYDKMAIPLFWYSMICRVSEETDQILIVDSSCDTILPLLRCFAKEHHYHFFVVRMEVPKKQVIKRLECRSQRLNLSTDDQLKSFYRVQKQYLKQEKEPYHFYFDNRNGVFEHSFHKLVKALQPYCQK